MLDSGNLPELAEIAGEIAQDLRSALKEMEEVLGNLEISDVDSLEESLGVEAA